MGMIFAEDLEAWQRWQRGRHALRRLRSLARPVEPLTMVLHQRGDEPRALFALDATTPTALASVLEPLTHLGDLPVAIVAPSDLSARLPGGWTTERIPAAEVPPSLRGVGAVVSAGHFLPVGQATHHWARVLGARYVVVQHGLLTPFAPPLAPNAHLLAFSAADAEFWRAGRSDVTSERIGSQLLWQASQNSHPHGDVAAAPTFLGQLHGAELARRISAATATSFCREQGAIYRPHPAETDRLSRWQHARWQRRGIRFAAPGSLSSSDGPVVSIFSTGVLEAAAAGRDAWVTCVRPPAWVREFWERYELAEWGGRPTARPRQPAREPAVAIADTVSEIVGGR